MMRNKKLLILIIIISIFIFPIQLYAIDDVSNNIEINNNLDDTNINEYNNLDLEDKETHYHLVIEDDANLLDNESLKNIENKMSNLTKYGNIIFKTINNNPYSTKDYVINYYNKKYGDANGAIFMIDMANRVIYLYPSGENYDVITDEKAQVIVDNVASYAGNDDYYNCAYKAFEELNNYFDTNNSSHLDVKDNETNYQLVIEDDANLLDGESLEKLKDKMSKLTKYGNIAFKTIDSNSMSTSAYARDYYHNKFGTASGTLFIIDMDNRMIYIFSDGKNYNIINSGKAEIITDNVYKYASNKDYYNCAYNVFDQVETLLEGGKILEPMRYISNIVVSIVTAFFINFIIVFKMTKIKKSSDEDIIKNCDVAVTASSIIGTKTGTHRVYSPVSDSSSGGGSSGGGGGGGSSGGGGGHSF